MVKKNQSIKERRARALHGGLLAQFDEFRQKLTDSATLMSEVASRRRDPYEFYYLGILKSTDPLVREKGKGAQELYADLMRDGKVCSAYNKRVQTMIAYPWAVEPVDSDNPKATQDAEAIADILKRCKFDQVCKDFMDALIIGMSVAEIIWQPVGGYLAPSIIKKREVRRFVFKDIENSQPELRLITRESMLEGVALPDKKFIVHTIGSVDDNPYGQGLGLQLYWPVFFKRCSVIAWNKLNDRYGSPTAWGKYAPGSSYQQQQTLLSALRSLSSDSTVITPNDSTVELLQANMVGNVTSHQALCAYMDNWVSDVLLGEQRGEQSGGALAAASVERRSILMDYAQADADLLSDTLNETLIKWLCELNGFEPCQVYRKIKEERDLSQLADVYTKLSTVGYRPTLEEVRAQFGDGFEAYQQPQQQVAGFGYAGGMGSLPAFAEGPRPFDQRLIDSAAAGMSDAELQNLMAGIIEPLVAAIEGAADFDDAIKAAQAALPGVDTGALQALLAQLMFGAGVLGRGVEPQRKQGA